MIAGRVRAISPGITLSRLLRTLRGNRFAARPQFEGYVNRRTIHHASGWARDRANTAAYVTVEAVIMTPQGERVLGCAEANAYYGFLSLQSFDDVRHGFQLIYDEPISDDACEAVIIRPAGTKIQLEFASLPELPPDPAVPSLQDPDHASPVFLGYIDGASFDGVSGWLLDVNNPGARLAFEVVIDSGGAANVIATGIAGLFYPPLQSTGSGDAEHGFSVRLARRLTNEERDTLIVRTADGKFSLPRAPAYQGYLDELVTTHASGWVHDRFREEQKLAVEAILITADGTQQLACGIADTFHAGLALGAPGRADHGFLVKFVPPLPSEKLGSVKVRLVEADFTLAAALTGGVSINFDQPI